MVHVKNGYMAALAKISNDFDGPWKHSEITAAIMSLSFNIITANRLAHA